MKRRVCCLILGLSILCLPVQQVYAAPAGPAAKAEEKKKPHETEKEKPVPPHEKAEKEKPVPPHEQPKPHEEKKGPLAEKPAPPTPAEKPVPPAEAEKPVPPHEKEKQEAEDKQPENTPTAVPTVTPTPTATPEASANSDLRQQVVDYALQFVGNPYKYGGTSLTNGADCSGFTQAVYEHFGYNLARSSKAQGASTQFMEVEVSLSELLPGDLIFYANSNGVVYHVAMYIGDGKVIHASSGKKRIVIANYYYYNMKPSLARRVIE